MGRKTQIIDQLDDADGLVSTNELADRLGVHWQTVASDLEELHERGKVDRKDLNARLTLWSTDEIRL